ncbi:DUF47 domain-containing protein [Salana multivorans]
MRFRLTPREDRVLELLAALTRHLPVAADLLAQLVAVDPAGRPDLSEQLQRVSREAGDASRAVQRRIAEVFVTPLDPADAYLLATRLDDCVDHLDEAGEHIVLYRLETLPADVVRQAGIIQRCAELATHAIAQLRDPQRMREALTEINRLSGDGDALHRSLLRSIFDGSSPAGTDPIQVVALKGVVDDLEECIDAHRSVASVLETIALRAG